MSKIKRTLSLVLVLATVMTVFVGFPPTEVRAAKATCSSPKCRGCNVECTFNPVSTLTWGDELSFSGKITSDDSKIEKVTVKAFDINNPDMYAFQTYTSLSVGSKTFYLSNVPDFTAGENLSEDWDGVTIVIYVVLQNETDVHHQFEYDIIFEEEQPEVTYIDIPSSAVVGDPFDIFIETNVSTYGVAIYVDGYHIKTITTPDVSKSTYKEFWYENYSFAKTNKVDSYGNDVQNVREMVVYPIDMNGNVIEDDDYAMSETITVLPADYEFSDFDVEAASAKAGESAIIKWDKVSSKNGSAVTYNLYINSTLIKSGITSTSYTVTSSQLAAAGVEAVGSYGVQVYACASGHRSKGSTSGLSITAAEPEEKESPSVELEVNGSTTSCEIKLGESFTYSGTAYGNDYTLNTVTVGISYFTSESNLEKGEGVSVYIRNKKPSTSSESVSGTIATGSGKYITGTDNLGMQTVNFYFDKAGIYTITLHGYSNEYGDTTKTVKIYVNEQTDIRLGDVNGDGVVTNKDRFVLNRYLAGMAGYTINKSAADIDGDGSINQADVDYLTNHLAGIIGYESFPERDASCLHTNCTPVYAGKTVFVNNTNKIDGVHSYYHMWSSVCKDCGEDLGVFQGDVTQTACSYNFEGYCNCGAFDTSKYSSWEGTNAIGKTVTVYETPYSSDWYGCIYKDEQVTVLGVIGDRYFIKYTVSTTRSTTKSEKYGYVPVNTIKSIDATEDVYSIEFDFETVSLPVSGRNVLLIPKDGSSFFYMYKNGERISDISVLNNLKLNFSKNNVEPKGTTLVGGKQGGYGTLTVSFEDSNGKIIYVSAPSCYIVAESNSVYSSKNKAVFSENEKEYIELALDMALSGGNIKRPRDADFTYGDNVLLNIEKIWDIVASLGRLDNPTTEQCSAVIAAYLEAYNDGTIGKYSDTSFLKSLKYILESIWDIGTGLPYEDVSEAFSNAIKTIQSYKGKPFSIAAAKDVFKSLSSLLLCDDVEKIFDICPGLAKKFANSGLSLKEFKKTLDTMSKSEKFFEFMEVLSFAGDVIEIGEDIFEAGCIVFGSYDKQLSLLTSIREVLIKAGYTKNDVQIKAIDNLIGQYEASFMSKLVEQAKSIRSAIATQVLETVISNSAPLFGILLDVAQIAASGTTAAEEAEYTMFRLISHAYICGLNFPYELFFNGEMTCSLDEAKTMMKLYITMAIHENVLAIAASGENGEFTDAEKQQFKDNISHMKKVYAGYLS